MPIGSTDLNRCERSTGTDAELRQMREKLRLRLRKRMFAWRVLRLREEKTDHLFFEVMVPTEGSNLQPLLIGNELSDKEVWRKIRALTDQEIPFGTVPDLKSAAESRTVILTGTPGWKEVSDEITTSQPCHSVAFAASGKIVGPNARRFRWHGADQAHLRSRGSLAGWRTSVATLAQHSSYASFAIMTALASPLLKFAGLTESVVFNLVSKSTTGKSNAARVGASVYVPADRLEDWPQFQRGFEERAAAARDLLLVLNAAEKVPRTKLPEVLQLVVHALPDGQSPRRSIVVADSLPHLTWRCIGLSTSNRTGRELAQLAKMSWEDQERVRFIDVEIPSNEGGIFDLLEVGSNRAQGGTALTKELELALNQHGGVLWAPWIKHLFTLENLSARVEGLMDRFVQKSDPNGAVETRIAKKFALVYAAGKIAVDAGLLPWLMKFPLQVTRSLFNRAVQDRRSEQDTVDGVLSRLAQAIGDREHFPNVRQGQELVVKGKELWGVRCRHKGRNVVGIRDEAWRHVASSDALAERVRQRLRAADVLWMGHGGRGTRQLPVHLTIAGETVAKPRFWVLEPKMLTALVGELQR